jgi:solute carrier family 13 (sodium-dependent dicarboxylate transporter), member 2/3/5
MALAVAAACITTLSHRRERRARRAGGYAVAMELAHRIGWSGLLAGPLLALLTYAALPSAEAGGLEHAGRATAAIGVWMAIWWMTEAIPLPATALLPVVLFPLLGVMPAAQALRPYASEIVFLFMGGFMIGLAMQRWELHRRIALGILRLVGTAPTRLVAGFMLATAALSMWISNTAATVMLLPVGVSTLELLRRHLDESDPAALEGLRNLGVCLMLGIAYGASIGGLGTLIGSPPNLVLANFARAELGQDITMLDWMKIGLPLVALMLPLTWLYLTRWVHPLRLQVPEAAHREIGAEFAGLGRMGRGERVVLVVFVATALGWIFRPQLVAWTGLAGLNDTVIAMAGALALFVLPVDLRRRVFALDWATATRLPWGVLLLFGGGLSLASAISGTGVDAWLASGFSALAGVKAFWVLLASAALVVFLTELSSNTAIANTFIPILAAAALGLGVEPMPILFAAALAATCAFMLPVATPPNAIVFASGLVSIGQMMRAGLGLNLIAIVLIALVVKLFGAWLLPAW